MADVTIDHRRQARRRCSTKSAQQIVRVQIKVSFFHPGSLSWVGCVTSVTPLQWHGKNDGGSLVELSAYIKPATNRFGSLMKTADPK